MKFIAKAINTLVTSYFLAAAFCAALLLLLIASGGISEISPWVRWPAVVAAFLFIRGHRAIAVCACAWAGAGMIVGLGEGFSVAFGQAAGPLTLTVKGLGNAAAPFALIVGTVAAMAFTNFQLPSFMRNIALVAGDAKE